MKKALLKTKIGKIYSTGKIFSTDVTYRKIGELNSIETKKTPSRTDIINYLIKSLNRQVTYLEIGVRNPEHNFNKITAENKYSVDPGVEFKENPVDFKMTSDDFFESLEQNKILNSSIKFDVIFIDGLHLAEQCYKDILNSLKHIKEDGFIILHDCNPPSEWHTRENKNFNIGPARNHWNGTTWKAFYKARTELNLFSCCIDSDWGVGILSKSINIGSQPENENPFFEFEVLNKHRKQHLNLITFEEFKKYIVK